MQLVHIVNLLYNCLVLSTLASTKVLLLVAVVSRLKRFLSSLVFFGEEHVTTLSQNHGALIARSVLLLFLKLLNNEIGCDSYSCCT